MGMALLTDDDTTDLEVVNSLSPDLITDLERVPALGECCLKQRPDVTDGEQHVTMTNQSL
jgi:hypothetical protein